MFQTKANKKKKSKENHCFIKIICDNLQLSHRSHL